MSKKPAQLRITKVRLTRKKIFISYHNGDEELTVKSRDNPLPSFTKSVSELVPLVLAICHLPPTYSDNMRATGLTLTEKGLVTLQALKSLDDAGSPLNIATPLRFMDLPEEEGSYTPPLTDKQVALVDEVIEQAKAYVKGDRAQGQLSLEDETDEDEEGEEKPDPKEGDLLDFDKGKQSPPASAAPEAPTPKKRTGTIRSLKKK